MNNKTPHPRQKHAPLLDLAAAMDQFIHQGGVINVIPPGETADTTLAPVIPPLSDINLEEDNHKKLELLKSLVAKGAGVNALQYSLRMNKKDVRRMAGEHGLKISYSRPIRGIRNEKKAEPATVDDDIAGHAMHYSNLGYTAWEIAQKLNLSVRQVWKIGQDYRFEFKQARERADSRDLPEA
jgi:hypothetical protein